MTKARDLSNLISTGVPNSLITLDANEIPNIDASKITSGSIATARLGNIDLTNLSASNLTSGTIPDARVSASAVSQHATSFDDNKIVNDISTLAIRQASNENKGAYNTNSMFVDVFQDGTGIGSFTTTDRSTNEYVASVVETLTNVTINHSNFDTYFGTQAQSSTSQGFMLEQLSGTGRKTVVSAFNPANTYNSMSAGSYTNAMAGHFAQNGGFSAGGSYSLGHNLVGNNRYYFLYKFKNGITFKPTSNYFIWRNGSSYNSDGNVVGVDASNNVTILKDVTPATTSNTGSITNNAGYTSAISTSTFFPTVGLAFSYTGSNGAGFDDLDWSGQTKSESVNATGNFISNPITAPSSVSKMGAIITYQDNAGTNTLNTDIVLQLSADNGTNFSTATLTALPDFATGIKMAKVNDLSVTASTQLKYKISFANQASGSKEARIRGVSLQY